jgi:hypothetical protein
VVWHLSLWFLDQLATAVNATRLIHPHQAPPPRPPARRGPLLGAPPARAATHFLPLLAPALMLVPDAPKSHA